MPRFTLTTLFLLVTLAAIAAAFWHYVPMLILLLIVFWPVIGSGAWALINRISVSKCATSTLDEQDVFANWRRGILIVGVIIQMVWLPFGVALGFAIGIMLGGGF